MLHIIENKKLVEEILIKYNLDLNLKTTQENIKKAMYLYSEENNLILYNEILYLDRKIKVLLMILIVLIILIVIMLID